MLDSTMLLEKLKSYGVGRRKLNDKLFTEGAPPRLGVYDLDDEDLCHETIKTPCSVPGCGFTADTLLQFENHYNGTHRYTCSQCKKLLPSPHFLDLHIQETHDSFFAVMSQRKPSYCCYIKECKEKFQNADDRLEHGVKVHKLPKDFRFEQKQKTAKKKVKKKEKEIMEVDNPVPEKDKKKFTFTNSKQKGFVKYSGRKFTDNDKQKEQPVDVNMDDIVTDLRTNLPE